MCPVAYALDARATRRHRRASRQTQQGYRRTGVHDIRGTTRRRFAAKEKMRIVLEGLRGDERVLSHLEDAPACC